MRVTISRSLLQRVIDLTAADPAREVCGLLFGTPHCIEAVLPCRNVADDPATGFEIDPAALIAAYRAARAGGPRVIGHYHSHPSGRAAPSDRDTASAAGDGAYWLIIAGDRYGCWQATPDGRGLEAIEIAPTPGCVARRGSPQGRREIP